MGLHRFQPTPSGRMGVLWTLAPIRGAALVEFGCMGHMRYAEGVLAQAGIQDGCKLYSTHLAETDIALGGTEKLEKAVKKVVENDRSRVIFLQPSSVPEVIGTDLPALAEELQPKYPDVRLLPFGSGGFDVTQHRGVQEALLTLVKALPVDTDKTREPSFNIIGSCTDIYGFQTDTEEIVRIMAGAFGIRPLCVLTSDTSVQDIENMGGAHFNLVLRREGEPAAKQLQKRFDTPYLLSRPYGIEGTLKWIKEVEQASGLTANRIFLETEREKTRVQVEIDGGSLPGTSLSLGGHADVVRGILSFGCGELGFRKGTCWCDSPDMGTDDFPCFSEDQWMHLVRSHRNGILMASGEALDWAGHSPELRISNPGTKWHRHTSWMPPFMGFRGAIHLVYLWANNVTAYR